MSAQAVSNKRQGRLRSDRASFLLPGAGPAAMCEMGIEALLSSSRKGNPRDDAQREVTSPLQKDAGVSGWWWEPAAGPGRPTPRKAKVPRREPTREQRAAEGAGAD